MCTTTIGHHLPRAWRWPAARASGQIVLTMLDSLAQTCSNSATAGGGGRGVSLSSDEPPAKSLLAPDTAPLADRARRALLRSFAGSTHSVSSMRSAATGACAAIVQILACNLSMDSKRCVSIIEAEVAVQVVASF